MRVFIIIIIYCVPNIPLGNKEEDTKKKNVF